MTLPPMARRRRAATLGGLSGGPPRPGRQDGRGDRGLPRGGRAGRGAQRDRGPVPGAEAGGGRQLGGLGVQDVRLVGSAEAPLAHVHYMRCSTVRQGGLCRALSRR
jgi:hypothetical protein